MKFTKVVHPDKHVGKPRHIRLMYEEITKMINKIYEEYGCGI